jgi:hypothetical protein
MPSSLGSLEYRKSDLLLVKEQLRELQVHLIYFSAPISSHHEDGAPSGTFSLNVGLVVNNKIHPNAKYFLSGYYNPKACVHPRAAFQQR